MMQLVSVGFLDRGEVVAHAMVIVKHLLVCAHVKIALKPIQVAKLDLCGAFDESAHLNGATWLNLLRLVISVGLVIRDLYLFVCTQKKNQ